MTTNNTPTTAEVEAMLNDAAMRGDSAKVAQLDDALFWTDADEAGQAEQREGATMTTNHTPPYVRIEAQQRMGDEYITYFVDVVTTDRNSGVKSTTNLRAVSDVHLARQIARDVAKGICTHVEDSTMTRRAGERSLTCP